VALAVVLIFHLYPRSGLDRVRHALDWSACTSVEEEHGARRAYSRGWSEIQSQAELICQDLGPHVYWVEFASTRARDVALRTGPPDEPYCSFEKAEILAYTAIPRADGDQICAKLGGKLHRAA
jgi:hypothetical protein